MPFHCGIIPIGQKIGNVTLYCVDRNSSKDNFAADATFEYVLELYIITVVCFVGILGNFMSIAVLRRDHERKEAMILLQILAGADAFYLLTALIRYPTKHLIESSNVYQRMQLYMFPVLKVAQCICIWTMVLVTVDRYVYVCLPLRAIRILTPRRRRLLALMVVVVAVIYNIPRFVDSCLMEFQDVCTGNIFLTRKVYLPRFNNTIYFDLYQYSCYIVLLYILPLACLGVLNAKLIKEIRRSRKRHVEIGGPPEETESNATLVLVIIVIVFIVCETPELIVKILSILDRWFVSVNISMATLKNFSTVIELLMVINSSSNFFIYLTLGNRFRLVIRNALVRVIRSNSTTFTTESMPLQNP